MVSQPNKLAKATSSLDMFLSSAKQDVEQRPVPEKQAEPEAPGMSQIPAKHDEQQDFVMVEDERPSQIIDNEMKDLSNKASQEYIYEKLKDMGSSNRFQPRPLDQDNGYSSEE